MNGLISGASGHPAGRCPEDLVHLGCLVGDRRDRGETDDGVAVAVHLLDAQSRKLVGNLGFDVAAEQLVDQVLRRQRMAHHAKAELDRLEAAFPSGAAWSPGA